jgi:REP element-mobilizing transposase RayT
MPRRPRSFHEGIYHLGSRGSDDRFLFLTDSDRRDFLERMASTWARFEFALHSYALLGNHYHVLLSVDDASLSQALQRLHTEYSRHHNRRHERKAHLFRAHPFARPIEDDGDLAYTCRYIIRNPVEAGLVADPLAWPWSSARAHAGLEAPPIPLVERPLREAFGSDERWRERFSRYVRDEKDERPA